MFDCDVIVYVIDVEGIVIIELGEFMDYIVDEIGNVFVVGVFVGNIYLVIGVDFYEFLLILWICNFIFIYSDDDGWIWL